MSTITKYQVSYTTPNSYKYNHLTIIFLFFQKINMNEEFSRNISCFHHFAVDSWSKFVRQFRSQSYTIHRTFQFTQHKATNKTRRPRRCCVLLLLIQATLGAVCFLPKDCVSLYLLRLSLCLFIFCFLSF